MKLGATLKRLNRIQRITLVLFVAVVLNAILDSTTGYQILGGDLLLVLFCISLVILILRSIRPLTQRLLWRLRNRLLVTYLFFGVVPLALVCIMLLIVFEVLFGQIAADMARQELERRTDIVYTAARNAALSAAAGLRSEPDISGLRTIIQSGSTVTRKPPQTELSQIPLWTKPGFKGLIWNDDAVLIAAHARAEGSSKPVDVFAYMPIDGALLDQLPSDLGSISLLAGNFRSNNGQVKVTTDREQNPNAEPVSVAKSPRGPVPAKGFWDWSFDWVSILKAKRLTGTDRDLIMTVSSRPSLIVPRLFGSLGRIAPILGIVLLSVAAIFLLVEVVSLILSLRLTRTITRAVHDLYIGTKHIASGEFSHKIPVRSKDQLSDLASSFNSMTERIQQLIEEVKEKEKLESELEIAREVQAQLFPKDIPHLKTLELAGVCKPARVVSGDYYDFIPVDTQRTAIVIGDISGKGISAALLMASVQAALHAQLSTMNGSQPDADSGAPSTSILVTRLNRQLYENTPPEKYATFYCALYDDISCRLAYTNAGHLRPILVRDGKASRLEISGMVVGMFADAPYDQQVIQLQQGDLLAAFTDGITESEDASGEQFGEERLAQLLVDNAAQPLAEIVELVTREVRAWAYDLDNQDDTTMLLARRV